MSRSSISPTEYLAILKKMGAAIPPWLLAPTKKNKFSAIKVPLHGFVFDSKIEAAYYIECRYRLCAGLISDLWIHTRFPLLMPILKEEVVVGYRISYYEDDFDYINRETGLWEVVDVKSKFTIKLPTYQEKKKRMWEQYGIRLTEIVR